MGNLFKRLFNRPKADIVIHSGGPFMPSWIDTREYDRKRQTMDDLIEHKLFLLELKRLSTTEATPKDTEA